MCYFRKYLCLLAALLPIASLAAAGTLHDERELHLVDVRQLTDGGENAEAYWSPDGLELIFQSTRPPYDCDQIFRLPIAEPESLTMVSTGVGRTTCSYFTADAERTIYSSTHAADVECPPTPDFSRGYVWPIYDSYQIYSAAPDGSDLRPLTDTAAYDAEATVCPLDGSIIFTSTRDGDLELYRMDADGGNVQRLTDSPGYDGGGFFSRDCSKIVWRASRPTGEALEDYQALLGDGLIRPGELELWVANADGSEARQVTYLGGANFAPYFYPDGDRIIFSSNHADESGREFDIWAINVDGTGLEQITYTKGFDGFPVFSPDGRWLAFASNRNQGKPGETDVYLARWESGEVAAEVGVADAYMADVAWLADDARDGRGLGMAGLEASAEWLEERFREIGLEPAAGEGSYRQSFDAPVDVERGPRTALVIDGEAVPSEQFVVPGFSANGEASGPVVFVEWGISSIEHQMDSYHGLDVEGSIVLVRRFTPKDGVFEDEDVQRRLGGLRYKAFTAKDHGAIGLLVADLPREGGDEEESPLPRLRVDVMGDAGIPVVVVSRAWAEKLIAGEHQVNLTADLIEHTQPVHNIIGRLAAGGERRPGAVVIGAHYDHLGRGGENSLAPDSTDVHNGADDNASGTAALLAAARRLVARQGELERDVLFAAFTGEESGLMGSTHLTKEPPPGMAMSGLVGMLNMDMVGRLRGNRVAILGSDSAEEWEGLLARQCDASRIGCKSSGDGYGPSDQTPFYAAGVPVLHFFTGAHGEYHTPGDDWPLINASGGAHIAALVADIAAELTGTETGLTYQEAEAPAPQGDVRSYGASLGTIPDYTGPENGRPGMLLSGVRPGGPADTAGLQRGDLIVELSDREIRDIYDLMYVLRQSKPGEESTIVVERDGERVEMPVVFGQSTGR
jgi:Tol biopolymer transport system component